MPKLHYTSLLPMKKVCLIGMPYGMPKLIFNISLYNWKIQCKLPPKTKRFCPLVLK